MLLRWLVDVGVTARVRDPDGADRNGFDGALEEDNAGRVGRVVKEETGTPTTVTVLGWEYAACGFEDSQIALDGVTSAGSHSRLAP